MNLYEVNATIEAMMNRADPETGELPVDSIEQFEAIELDKVEKIESLLCYLRNVKSDVVAYKTEEDVFKARRVSAEAHVERLERFIRILNERFGPQVGRTWKSELRGGPQKLTLKDPRPYITPALDVVLEGYAAKTGESLTVQMTPEGFETHVTEYAKLTMTIDKAKLKEALKKDPLIGTRLVPVEGGPDKVEESAVLEDSKALHVVPIAKPKKKG